MRLFTVIVPLAFAGAAASSGWLLPVHAEDQPFLTMDSTDIEPEFGRELEQNFTWASGKPGQSFNAILGETEFEYGLSDQIKLAAIIDYDWTRARNHAVSDAPAISGTALDSVGGEIVYQAMNVYFDPIGLGFLVSPAVGRNSRNIEAKVLLQKNFLNDRLRAVANLGGDFATERDADAWSDVSALTFDAGIAYNITWEWSAALEFNAEHSFAGLLLNGRGIPAATTYFAGPTIQYVAHPWTASLGAQAQLPWASDASHTPGALDHGFSADAERFRVMLRITRDTL